MVLATGARHPTTDCACRELTCALSFAIGVRSQGSFDAEVSGVSPSPASPRRGCLSVKHPARPASSSTSATKDWSFSAPYIRTKRRSCPSPRLSPQTVFPDDQTAQALFSATQTTSTLFPEIDRRTSWGGGRAAWGVSSWSLFRCLCFSVAAWRKEAPDGGDLGDFGLDARPRAHPAGQHGPCAEVRKAAGLTFSRLHFGGFAPRAWRVSAGRLEKKSRFFRHSTCAFGSFLIPPFDPS